MKLFSKMLFAAAVALAVTALTAGEAAAQRAGCNGPFCNTPRYPTLQSYLFHNSSHNQPLPTFQAAPWYLYWPYDAHFMTPAPVNAPFNGPPIGGNFPVNPYFPAPGGSFGPMPGGPAPYGMPNPGFGPGPIR